MKMKMIRKVFRSALLGKARFRKVAFAAETRIA
jgi:hypothetical protein